MNSIAIGQYRQYKFSSLWILIVLVAFGLVYFCSLTLVSNSEVYASSIAYQLLGQNTHIQPLPYIYPGMLDKILSFLPPQEHLLRTVAIGFTSIAAVLLAILIQALVFNLLVNEKMPRLGHFMISLSILLASPALFYFGLIYSPVIPALCLVILSHLLLRVSLLSKSSRHWQFPIILLSSIMFGLGVSFHASLILYGVIVLADLLTWQKPEKNYQDKFKIGVIWISSSIAFSILWLIASGNTIFDLVGIVKSTFSPICSSQPPSLDCSYSESSLVKHYSQYTPGLIVFSLIGFVNLIRTQDRLIWLVMAGLPGLLLWPFSGTPITSILITLPVLLVCFVSGFIYLWNYFVNTQYIFAYGFVLVLLLVGPWFFRFPFASTNSDEARIVFGYGRSLLGGESKDTLLRIAHERQESIDSALSMDIPLVITRGPLELYLIDLYAIGYTTSDPSTRSFSTGNFTERRFSNPKAASITLYFSKAGDTSITTLIPELKPILLDTGKLILTGDSETLSDYLNGFSNYLTTINNSSVILDYPRTVFRAAPIYDYIPNPGIGWQRDPGATNPDPLPETVSYIPRSQISWKILNPSEDEYNWSPIDEQISQAEARGAQISFRVSTMGEKADGAERIPDWVLNKGAVVLESGEPDYSNCVYQEEWGAFVDALQGRYDGNPLIAFIDISGYGEFNEWNWGDQTEWDDTWDAAYSNGNATLSSFETLDGQARRRLADAFIGGSFGMHTCRDDNQQLQTVSYSYQGFQTTQLLMPYAGIRQSLQYVYSIRQDVGFRYDCLGREGDKFLQEIDGLWLRVPVVFELCTPNQVDLDTARATLLASHGSLVHNNDTDYPAEDIVELMSFVGYRYYLKEAVYRYYGIFNDNALSLSMIWQNVGSAPNYPRMGQDFQLHIYLVEKSTNQDSLDIPVNADISSWLPADDLSAVPPENHIDLELDFPAALPPGEYFIEFSIIDERTGLPIDLAIQNANSKGRHSLGSITIIPER